MRPKTVFAIRREELELTQPVMAALCGTVQSEISKFERTGEIDPDDIARWAKAYQWSKTRFRFECEQLAGVLPLWKCSVGPVGAEVIVCRRRKSSRRGRIEGLNAALYSEAPIIGEIEQQNRRQA